MTLCLSGEPDPLAHNTTCIWEMTSSIKLSFSSVIEFGQFDFGQLWDVDFGGPEGWRPRRVPKISRFFSLLPPPFSFFCSLSGDSSRVFFPLSGQLINKFCLFHSKCLSFVVSLLFVLVFLFFRYTFIQMRKKNIHKHFRPKNHFFPKQKTISSTTLSSKIGFIQ